MKALAWPLSMQRGSVHEPPPAAGFTLIELVVVMSIIALLLTIAVPRYFHSMDNGRNAVQRQNIAVVRDAIDKFFGDQGRYPDALDELVAKRYLREVPLDPLTEHRDWVVVQPPDPALPGAVYDIHSALDKDGLRNTAGDTAGTAAGNTAGTAAGNATGSAAEAVSKP